MKHRSSRELYAHWTACRGDRPAPERGEIDPGAIRGALADCFIAERDGGAALTFRLAGTRLCGLFGRELRGSSLVPLWAPESRRPFGMLAAMVTDETTGVVAGVKAETGDAREFALEFLMLPLSHRGQFGARMIGVLAPLAVPDPVARLPVWQLTLGTYRHARQESDDLALPSLVAAPPNGRPRRGFVVYDGGLSEV
jgi:hypothetical protein